MPQGRRLRTGAALALILICAAALRLSWVTWSLPNRFHTATYNCDESTALTALQGMDPAKLDFNPVSDKLPYALSEGTFNIYTYGALLKVLSALKYATLTPDKDFYYSHIGEMAKLFLAGRLLSVFYGLLTVMAVFILARNMFGPLAGLLAAFFTAIMPAHVVHSRYIIMNVPGVFWIVLAFIFMKNIVDKGELRDYVLAGVSTGLAAATRFSALPLFIMLFPAHLMSAAPGKRKLFLAFAAALSAFFIGAPYTFLDLPGFMKGMSAVSRVATSGNGLSFYGHISFLAGSLTEAMGLPVFLLSLAGVTAALVRRSKHDMLLLSWVIMLTALFFKAGQGATPGRILPALPFMAILAAAALSRAWGVKPWAGRTALAAVAVQAFIFYTAYFGLLSVQDIRDTASEWMAAEIKPGSTIGLLREPSWFSPGLIDRKYRHPDHAGLPDYAYVRLSSGKWGTDVACDKLGSLRPDYIIITDQEAAGLAGGDFRAAARKYGYSKIKDFEASFSFFRFRLRGKVPGMFFIPNYIYVFQKSRGPRSGPGAGRSRRIMTAGLI
ncbi:MAG: hypothetical protein A2081_01335 [Elusimicrobia bacterium GWC2_61_19]|nr:MAG: hypothetical protein A2081_01335 [Elusimicrobia bacterium GWC2_61_19]